MRGPHHSSSSEGSILFFTSADVDKTSRISPQIWQESKKTAATLNSVCRCALKRRWPKVEHAAERKRNKNGWKAFQSSTLCELLVLSLFLPLSLSVAVCPPVCRSTAGCGVCLRCRRRGSARLARCASTETSPPHLNLTWPRPRPRVRSPSFSCLTLLNPDPSSSCRSCLLKGSQK